MVQNSDDDRRQTASTFFQITVSDLKATLERLDESHFTAVQALAEDVLAAWEKGG